LKIGGFRRSIAVIPKRSVIKKQSSNAFIRTNAYLVPVEFSSLQQRRRCRWRSLETRTG
jgi:hypothetical protein